jgi:hypothetical protein
MSSSVGGLAGSPRSKITPALGGPPIERVRTAWRDGVGLLLFGVEARRVSVCVGMVVVVVLLGDGEVVVETRGGVGGM